MSENASHSIYGLIGCPVTHSLSPLMHNAAFRVHGIDAEYRLFQIEPEQLKGFLLEDIPVIDTEGKTFSCTDVVGFNITLPYKVRARQILQEQFPLSDAEAVEPQDYYVKISGAVNTVSRKDGVRFFNTDADGFFRAIQEKLNFDATDKNVLLIGCGGAGRAIIARLTWWKYSQPAKKIYVYDKSEEAMVSTRQHLEKIQQQLPQSPLLDKVEFISAQQISQKIKECQLLINASPVGMENDSGSMVNAEILAQNKKLFVFDVVYNRQTQLIKDAQSLRLKAIGGLEMLLYQGVAAFELWTGLPAPVAVMREALYEGVKTL